MEGFRSFTKRDRHFFRSHLIVKALLAGWNRPVLSKIEVVTRSQECSRWARHSFSHPHSIKVLGSPNKNLCYGRLSLVYETRLSVFFGPMCLGKFCKLAEMDFVLWRLWECHTVIRVGTVYIVEVTISHSGIMTSRLTERRGHREGLCLRE